MSPNARIEGAEVQTQAPRRSIERFSGDPVNLLGKGLQAILFVESDQNGICRNERRFAEMPWPPYTQCVVVDAETAPQAVEWFGIRTFPTVAIVRDGAVLALEASCDEDVCRELLELAARRHPACLEGC